jgi:heptosyltransferase-2
MNKIKNTILIRVPNWVGDAVVATSILKPLKLSFPQSRIVVVAKRYVAPLFQHHAYLDGVTEFTGFAEGVRRISGDSGIILPNSFSSALLFRLGGVKRRIGYRSEGRAFLLTDALPLPSLREEHLVENYKRLALRYLGGDIDAPFEPSLFLSAEEKTTNPFDQLPIFLDCAPAIVDPGSAYGAAKEWQIEKYAAIVDFLAVEKKLPVILLGSSSAQRISDSIKKAAHRKPHQLTGKLTLRQAIHVISKSSFYLSPDTGGMHIAAALGIPQVAIFGSSTPLWTRPLNKKSRVVYLGLECSPCFQRRCPLNTHACLADISPEDVMAQIEELI